jgi:transketolase
MTVPTHTLHWTETDRRAVDTVRLLALDAVEAAGNGHPGTAVSLAPAAYLLFQRHLRHDPADPHWLGRDRFVLSAGHTSLTLYLQLYLSGYPLTLDDLRALRTWGSATPGHPEWRHTPGVETTTGPLGQGVGNAVGMAMDARRVRGLLDPDAAPGASPFDHIVYALASDGDMQEGVSAEASSLAGTQQLGNLVLIWDDNRISIEDDTSVAFTEDVCARYEAYGWHVQRVDWTRPDGSYVEDVAALDAALTQARAVTHRPSFVALRTIIGWPAPTKQNTGGIHGSKAGEQEVRATKALLGADPDASFAVADDVLAHARQVAVRGADAHRRWDEQLAAWRAAHPGRSALLDRLRSRALPDGWQQHLPDYADQAGNAAVATRVASGAVLTALAPQLPELWGGSADLAGSNNTSPKGEPSFLPPQRSSAAFRGDWYGRVLHFGVREHAMGAVLNGIALGGLTRPYGGTFLVFSDYMRPSVRLAALMGLPVTYVWTHDSIGLGEDGPTHQPVEHLAALRAIPGLAVVRPADAVETVGAWAAVLRRHSSGAAQAPLPDGQVAAGAVADAPVPTGPVGLALTRQDVPVLTGSDAAAVDRGGYVLRDSPTGRTDVLLLATGSEVSLAVEAADLLAAEGIGARVVSLPCLEWFAEQPQPYRDAVLPPSVRARVSVEAGVALPWARLLGEHGRAVSIEHFGASADHRTLYEQFGITAAAVADAARAGVAAAGLAAAGKDA